MMHALKPSSLFRPSSRPSSPAPHSSRSDPSAPADRASRSNHKLSLTSFRRPASAPLPSPAAAIVQDGSYLEVLSLKLSEAVSKALAQPTGPAAVQEQVNGKRPIPAGRGHAVGALIATELNAACDNAHLRKAVLRSLHRPLSTLVTTLSGHLLPLLSSPAFLNPAVPTPQAPNANSVQSHALAYATFAGEAVRDGLTTTVGRVVNPLAGGIMDELKRLIEGLETTPAASGISNGNGKTAIASKISYAPHPSIVTLQSVMPVYARALSRYFATPTSQATLATHLIDLLWRGLIAISHRVPPPVTPPTSPASLPAVVTKRGRSSTPPTTPPASRFMLKLPPSRPPSPHTERITPSIITDARLLYDLLSTLPRPTGDSERSRFAREAVDDAFTQLKSLIALLELVHTDRQIVDAKELEIVTADMFTLIALPVLLHAYVFSGQSPKVCTVASMLGIPEEQYRAGCLSKPARAEECTVAVGKRVLGVLGQEGSASSNPEASAVVEWLKMEVASAQDADP
ncbi:hypothetical protein EW146_g4412 [Bondarzewia mesenterica]|uniref:Uncharacterized protein n=1 Tax=Bondarzewia mesenterica TaxID=1095465 RepID=A0A4S4LUL3_9AGAM|nr:hypothetical protein EW146_g4412 [Bondarzewia mesenterica]